MAFAVQVVHRCTLGALPIGRASNRIKPGVYVSPPFHWMEIPLTDFSKSIPNRCGSVDQPHDLGT